MTSEKQLVANRANAKRSTGPKSKNGKARSSKNALTHGLTGADIVVPGEDPEEFEALRAGLYVDFEPTGTIEHELIDRMADVFWRLRRVPKLEALLIEARHRDLQRSDPLYKKSPDEMWDHHICMLAGIRCRQYFGFHELLKAKEDGRYERELEHFREEVAAEQRARAEEMARSNRHERELNTGLMSLFKSPDDANIFATLSRYETSLMNMLTRTLAQLCMIQSCRGG